MKTRLFLLLFIVASVAHAQIPVNGLVGCYLFAGGTNDTSGNANDLTNFGATLTADRFGGDGSAYKFDGWSNYMLSNIPTLPAGNAPRTIAAFFKTPKPEVRDQYVAGWGSQETDQDWYLEVNNGNLRLVLWNDDIILTPIKADKWYHFAATYADSTVAVYVNGQLAATSMHHLSTDSLGYLSVGASLINDSMFTGYLTGVIDDICIYDRALSASEISALYHAPQGASMFAAVALSEGYDTTSTAAVYDTTMAPTQYSQTSTPPLAGASDPLPPSVAGAQYDQADPHGFQAALNPYGEWVNASLGYGWRPFGVGPGWRPYLNGRWEWTDNGWYWVSTEPFGWATYHYGRWYVDDFYGWVWIAGATWGPSWVEWRSNDNYVGWAPLTPACAYTPGGMIVENNRWSSPAPYWTFVSYGSFGASSVYGYAEPVGHNQGIIANSHRNIVITSHRGRVVNSGLDIKVVDSHLKAPVQRVAIVEGNQSGGDRVMRGSGIQRIQVYRPKIARVAMRVNAPVAKPVTTGRVTSKPANGGGNNNGNGSGAIPPAGQDQSGANQPPQNQQDQGSSSGGQAGGNSGSSIDASSQPAPSVPTQPVYGGGGASAPPAFPTGGASALAPTGSAAGRPTPASPTKSGGTSNPNVKPSTPVVVPPTPVVTPPQPTGKVPTPTPTQPAVDRRYEDEPDKSPKVVQPLPTTPPATKMHLHRHLHSKKTADAPAPSAPVQVSRPAPVSSPAPKKQETPVVIKPDPTHH